ncbi:MAG: glycoside hydrolase family 66 protein [Oryzihumus sp.]
MSTLAPRLDIRPARAGLTPGARVDLLVDAPTQAEGRLVIEHLGQQVVEQAVSLVPGRQTVTVDAPGGLAQGGYAVWLRSADQVATTAFDILANPGARPRYGFLADFRAGREDVAQVADSLRAFHISHVQFYDWMYRHAELLPPQDEFVDTLGRPLSLTTVRAFIQAVHDAGAQALAYAAVYGAGREYAQAHPEQILTHRGGEPWMLGDFLWIADISQDSPWAKHIVNQMAEAVSGVGFDGLHLDQYGDPKVALSATGATVDLATEFPALIDAVREALPEATLIFNNVNDFPTRATALARQDATYIEVWSPHDTHADLVDLVRTARDVAPGRPAILAAYLEPFAQGSGEPEVAAAKLALSTVWAAGGQYLLFGERHGALVHPYYPNFATLEGSAVDVLRAFADFSVANGDLLFDPAAQDGTGSLALGINEDVLVEGCPVSGRPEAGSVWVRTSTVGDRLVVQLVDYRAQNDARWNVPRTPTGVADGLSLRVRVASASVDARFGHPLGGPGLGPVPVRDDGEYVVVDVPDFDTWAVLALTR